MALIKFIKTAAPIGYAYTEGDVADFNDATAAEIIERGFAEPAATEPAEPEIKQAVAEQPAEVKKAVKKK
jgi:hypothetical protein